ncbi:hypothetical protein BT96DRAFT_185974 [Gymnopus androsaceus JB14]|uniref:Uncharacterized protein n=1 Tax=Gymnopus androsaceus JB14 TaxID=1447944 RepID=A0A6A4H8H7_9AGAR|nr:hypothetical protein BT96DRAFT_185974 [Gymnopus androsaceus JB14]
MHSYSSGSYTHYLRHSDYTSNGVTMILKYSFDGDTHLQKQALFPLCVPLSVMETSCVLSQVCSLIGPFGCDRTRTFLTSRRNISSCIIHWRYCMDVWWGGTAI